MELAERLRFLSSPSDALARGLANREVCKDRLRQLFSFTFSFFTPNSQEIWSPNPTQDLESKFHTGFGVQKAYSI